MKELEERLKDKAKRFKELKEKEASKTDSPDPDGKRSAGLPDRDLKKNLGCG